ncbi:GTP pyrophosphokinase [Komagataeibacter sp. NFXK3]
MTFDSNEEFLEKEIPKYNHLKKSCISIIERLLHINNIEYLNVSGRVKDKKSALEKVERKKYTDIEKQMTDLCGVRIIVFFESDIKKIIDMIRGAFEIDEDNSLDQTSKLGNDKIGYRSVHFVCTLGKRRGDSPEYKGLVDLKFELQIRTVLQHAWAELAHDRTYKFNSGLPSDISRKINLYAGLLEIADLGFNEIINDINNYSDKISKETAENLSKEEINSITLTKFFLDFCSRNNFDYSKSNLNMFKSNSMPIINELKSFGIFNIDELNNIFTEEFINYFNSIVIEESNTKEVYIYGLIRCILMYSDIDKYFRLCNPDWSAISKRFLNILYKKYGKEKVMNVIHENGKSVKK